MAQILIRLLAIVTWLGAAAPAAALELVMFSRPGCPYCVKWDREVAPIYVISEEGKRAPLVRRDISARTPALKLMEPVIYTPTFVLVDQGAEIGRITGFINDDMFWGTLGKLLQRAPGVTQ